MLKNEIIKESLNYKGSRFEENYFFSNLIKGFKKDYKIYKESTASLYESIFGEEYSLLFEDIQNNIELLNESFLEQPLLFEQILSEDEMEELLKKKPYEYSNPIAKKFAEAEAMRKISPTGGTFRGSLERGNLELVKPAQKAIDNFKATSSSITKEVPQEIAKNASSISKNIAGVAQKAKEDAADYVNRQADKLVNPIKAGAKATSGFLSGLWEKIKTFGKGLAEKFPGVAGFLKKGLDWIAENPLTVVGVAGGTLLLGKLIKTLKEKGDAKRAAKLQAALDSQKGANK